MIPDFRTKATSREIGRFSTGFWAISEMRRNSAERLSKKRVIIKQSWNEEMISQQRAATYPSLAKGIALVHLRYNFHY